MPRTDVADPASNPEALVDADPGILATALCGKTDDLLTESPKLAPWRPVAVRTRDWQVGAAASANEVVRGRDTSGRCGWGLPPSPEPS